MLPLSASSLTAVFNHLVLPPKLPGKQDSDIGEIERQLAIRLISATGILRDLSNDESTEAWGCIQRSVKTCSIVNEDGRLNQTTLLDAFRRLQDKDGLILHVAEQNAGLFIRRHASHNNESVVFEAFEASPDSESVISSEGALQWDFPGSAVSISQTEFDNPSFQESLAAFLEQASTESIKRFAAHSRKAGVSVIETRDAVDPSLITQMLMTLLEANGCPSYPLMLRKRVRDDVCWDNADIPWRRCPYWLVLRVSIQRLLYLNYGSEAGRAYYKFLICLVLSRLLVDSLGHLSLELCTFLKVKLCRRLAKLEVDKTEAPSAVRHVYVKMFTAVGPVFQQTIQQATEKTKSAWTAFKNVIRRPVPSLPLRADDRDLQLCLSNSLPYLQDILQPSLRQEKNHGSFVRPLRPPADDTAKASMAPFRIFADRYFSLTDLEARIESRDMALPSSTKKCEKHCMFLAHKIETYLDTVGNAYDSNPEQMSIFFLNLFELWISMDECATDVFPLLKDYHPGFHPQLLDVLQLPRLQDMRRLQRIQTYLHLRSTQCTSSNMTIFIGPVEGCFAARYFGESENGRKLQNLQRSIEIVSEKARISKEKEWMEASATYSAFTTQIFSTTCTEKRHDDGSHDIRGCTHCYAVRQRRRLRICIHENPLPSNDSSTNIVQKQAILFELGIPKAFALYRDVTWRIRTTFGYPNNNLAAASPKVLLRAYSQLKLYMNSSAPKFSLASTTKSHLDAHYKSFRLPIALFDVIRPLGLNVAYYDSRSRLWPKDLSEAPNFAHLCGTTVSAYMPNPVIYSTTLSTSDTDGPSSYEVIASQTHCPPELTVHEFMTYQSLSSGKTRRWFSMLVELGSSNLNFSVEATMLLFCQLALQAGPTGESDVLRAVHVVFRDNLFCERLIDQIGQRIDGISANWRENYCMEMLLTLNLRLCSLGSGPIVEEGVRMIEKVRAVTLGWISLLRVEIRGAMEADAAERAAGYALWAALLCRRTYSIYADEDGSLDADTIRPFIEASIALQEVLVIDPVKLSPIPRKLLIRDLKMACKMLSIICKSVEINPDSLVSAINSVWPEIDNGPRRRYSDWQILSPPYEYWIASTVEATEFTSQQVVHYHLLEGHLLVDRKPLGRLPANIRDSEIIKELFGNQHLLTFPSALSGMTYMLTITMNGHQIHFGFRKQKLLVRACVHNTVLEFIDRSVFGNGSDLDLPAPLVQDCVHWLDLRSGLLELRRRPYIWKHRPGNWTLNLHTRRAHRRKASLVDPRSNLFRRVAGIFQHFEHHHMLTLFQPSHRNLTVELKRLQLDFTVNKRKLFRSPQLRSEIDPDQDAGTLYGLQSKIVLRDSLNPFQRSIIVPMGKLKYEKAGIHVAVRVENDGSYGKYMIDEVLGRLQCPSEPLLLYSKAQFHAFTSFVLPDPLTGRTGTEEALHCLQSGCCQPWTPINSHQLQLLNGIAKLTPKRHYYPKNLKRQQIVLWDPQLTISIQHDSYRPIIEAMFTKLERLSTFTFQKMEMPPSDPENVPQLRQRSYSRRCLYERSGSYNRQQKKSSDISYRARDRLLNFEGTRNVYQTVTLLREQPSCICKTPELGRIFQRWPIIGGYDRTFESPLLSDRLHADLALEWGGLVNLCRNSGSERIYHLMFQLGVIAFGKDVDMDIVRILIAYFVCEDLKILDPPIYHRFTDFRLYQAPTLESLMELIEQCYESYNPQLNLKRGKHSNAQQLRSTETAKELYEERRDNDGRNFASFLLCQWPCQEPTVEGLTVSNLEVEKVMDVVRPEWLRLFQNLELSQHVTQVQKVLKLNQGKMREERPWILDKKQELFGFRCRGAEIPTLSQDLLLKNGPTSALHLSPKGSNAVLPNIASEQAKDVVNTILHPSVQDRTNEGVATSPFSREMNELGKILDKMSTSQSFVRKQYGEDLKQSLEALKTAKSPLGLPERPLSVGNLDLEIGKSRQAIHDQYNEIHNAFTRGDSRFLWLREGNLWPCITPLTLLEQLRSTSNNVFGDHMKEDLTVYAVSITRLQRLLRIKNATIKGDLHRLREEQGNSGHGNWRPIEYPDWLLLEIDANILIRNEQVDVALSTISPASGSNSVLQMNMGQGKTTCIIPMVAAVLADGKQLSRIIVPKSLLLQAAQILQSRLGGLLGREIKHVPFSRKTSTTSDTIQAYYELHQEMLTSSGVILALPEHILSFMLSGLQRLSDSRIQEATQMVKIQHRLRRTCRDILDECDFTLAVKTQLIYPSGSQLLVDGHPHRWETAQALLNLVDGHLWNLQHDFPHSMEVVKRTTVGFPVIHFLRKDVEDALTARLVDDICNNRTCILSTGDLSKADLQAIRLFISEEKVDSRLSERITQMFPNKPAIVKKLFLLRGLFVNQILLLCLQKRWNVQYGLHPDRDPVAVPFHAKGVPSEQAEWGHPDVAILFTCLAFYYSGLNVTQLRQALQYVLRSDDPSSGYDRWTHSSVTLPESLRQWNLINVDDDGQVLEIWHHLRFTNIVIDHYLNNFVFPVHAKQFCIKLQASGWDIPLLSLDNRLSTGTQNRRSGRETSSALTTGFSGTNDNRRILPLTIKQEDLPGLSHTNAEVLTYLLQARNRRYVLAVNSNNKCMSELELIDKLRRMEIRILIDAGAHILEMNNKSLVKAWLENDHHAQAAVYFDTDNKAWVLYRNGKGVPLLASPFADNLENCLVYLDEAHTRGTDLKLPTFARGALTLGLGQTKDQTVQAAMRLRQLGSTQSITFFAPPEVHQSILDLCNKKHGDHLDSFDVICWLLEQTCSGNEQLQQLYFAQGADFCCRSYAAWKNSRFLTDVEHRTAYLQVLQQPEQQTLERLYKPTLDLEHNITTESLSIGRDIFMEELMLQQKGSHENSNKIHSSALEEVEQEREVAIEVEEVRQVQKPEHFESLIFPGLNPAILHFTKTGELVNSHGCDHAFMALSRTELSLKYKISESTASSRLYVSAEFMRTVQLKEGRRNDNFLRPVNWVLWSPGTQTALIIIPEEAELLIPIIRAAEPSQTHLLVYAAPVIRKMLHFNQLTYYSLPRLPEAWKSPAWLTIELGILAGRLYFDFAEYATLTSYLRVTDIGSSDLDGTATGAGIDGIGNEGERKATAQQIQSFTQKPLSFMQEWLAIRRHGQDFMHTPMGYMCQGRPLRASHPFFVTRKALGANAGGKVGVGLDLGGAARAGPAGLTQEKSDGDTNSESDATTDEEEDEVSRLQDKDTGGEFEPDSDTVALVDSEARSVLEAMSESGKDREDDDDNDDDDNDGDADDDAAATS